MPPRAASDRTRVRFRAEAKGELLPVKFNSFVVYCGALQVTLVLTPVAWAQNVPFNIGGALRQSEEAQKPPLPAATAVPVLPKLVEPQLVLKDNETLFIRTFKVEGPNLGAGADVQEILAPYQNRKLNFAAINEASDKITTLYRTKGYLLAKAYVPVQDARSGVLLIKLVPGEYGTITVKNESLVSNPVVGEVIEQARTASPYVRKDDLERVMLLTSDLAGADVPRIATAPGQQPGTSDLAFDVPPTRRIDGYLLGDNYGAPWTGNNELSGAVNVNSPLGLGDKISAFGLISEDSGLKNGRVAYSLPLGFSGLKTEIGVFRTTYALGGTFAGLDATGTADGITATLAYALKRQVDESYYVSGNFTHKVVNDNAFGISLNNRTINLGTLALSRDTAGTVFGLPLKTNATLSYTEGHVDFPDPDQLLANILGVDTAGYYSRVNLSYVATLGLTDKLSFSTNIRGQKALFRKSLDTSEQFYLTGFFGVRSFDQGFGGDSGYLVTPELKYALPDFLGYRHAIGVFTDAGGAQLENPQFSVTQKEFTQLNDVGAAYYATYDYLPNRSLLLKAQVAHTYGSSNGAELYNKGTKVLLQVGFTF
jgi:hemolysin activation/secretion protein